MLHRIRTVVIPAAGRGTRLLPLTRSTPKELLAVYDSPVLQFALDEAASLGAERVVIVSSPTKGTIEAYVNASRAGRCNLRIEGGGQLQLATLPKAMPHEVEVIFAFQTVALGLGHAILCARDHMLDGYFGVILPDDLILGVQCLPEMARHFVSGHMIAAMDVPMEKTSSYGMFVPSGDLSLKCVPVSGLIEKPRAVDTPSRLAAVGRYILDPKIFETLSNTPPGAGNEIQLTDAISQDAETVNLTACRFSGARFDCGNMDGLLEAAVARRAMLGGKVRALEAAE